MTKFERYLYSKMRNERLVSITSDVVDSGRTITIPLHKYFWRITNTNILPISTISLSFCRSRCALSRKNKHISVSLQKHREDQFSIRYFPPSCGRSRSLPEVNLDPKDRGECYAPLVAPCHRDGQPYGT